MKLNQTIVDQRQSLLDILKALNNRLTPGDNFQCKILGPILTPAASVEFAVSHFLGRVPIAYMWNVDQNAVVFDSRRSAWTDTQMFLQCSVQGVNLYLIVF